jgi:hypothetical protein
MLATPLKQLMHPEPSAQTWGQGPPLFGCVRPTNPRHLRRHSHAKLASPPGRPAAECLLFVRDHALADLRQRTITLEIDAYERLRRAKRTPRESFSEVVRRFAHAGGRDHRRSMPARSMNSTWRTNCRTFRDPRLDFPRRFRTGVRASHCRARHAVSANPPRRGTLPHVHHRRRVGRDRAKWETFIRPFRFLGYHDEVAWRFGEIFRELRRKGSLIGANDMWIAATALANGQPLVTRNAD